MTKTLIAPECPHGFAVGVLRNGRPRCPFCRREQRDAEAVTPKPAPKKKGKKKSPVVDPTARAANDRDLLDQLED